MCDSYFSCILKFLHLISFVLFVFSTKKKKRITILPWEKEIKRIIIPCLKENTINNEVNWKVIRPRFWKMKELPLREAHCNNVNENEPFNPVPGGWSCSEEGTSVIANTIKSWKYQLTMPLPFGSNLHFLLLAVITPFLTFYYFVFCFFN